MRFIATLLLAALLGSPQQPFPRDPVKEMQRRAEKEASDKNYQELREAAAELADLSKQINSDIEDGGKDVISVRIFERLDRIDKLTKRIREKAKGAPAAIPKAGGENRNPILIR